MIQTKAFEFKTERGVFTTLAIRFDGSQNEALEAAGWPGIHVIYVTMDPAVSTASTNPETIAKKVAGNTEEETYHEVVDFLYSLELEEWWEDLSQGETIRL